MPYGITDMFSGGGSTLLGKLMDQRGKKTHTGKATIRVGQLYRQDTPQPPKEQFQPKENFRHYFTLTSAKVKSRVTDFEKPDNRLELGVLVKMPVKARTTKNIDYP
ncbi:hypothetical protein CDAR_59241 [Caerostris darwini]|uniref:Uncharacterized protein n=1 Tax=Caerostris darwini TaxID=1538125 RepID=A0AAV4X2A9_9ARAC|nr:hypothetical protein CDAR_59241 [Caerostris darwini]